MAGYKRWRLEFDNGDAGGARRSYPDPPGFEPLSGRELTNSVSGTLQSHQLLDMKQQALYSRATSQFKNIGMLAFMMWMSGSQVHLFSIMMTVSGVYQPLMAIFNSGEAFPVSDSDDGRLNILLPRLLYCLINFGGLMFAIWKVNGMGLLPTHASDYVSAMRSPLAEQSSLLASKLVHNN